MNTIKEERSAIWGGGTIGLIVGIILWILNGDPIKIVWSILIGAGIGLFLELITRIGKVKK